MDQVTLVDQQTAKIYNLFKPDRSSNSFLLGIGCSTGANGIKDKGETEKVMRTLKSRQKNISLEIFDQQGSKIYALTLIGMTKTNNKS